VRQEQNPAAVPWQSVAIRLAAVLAAVLAWLAAPAPAAADVDALPAAGAGPVAEVPDGDTIVLADGRVVRLAGVLAPEPAPERRRGRAGEREPDGDPGRLAAAARERLAALVAGRRVELRAGGRTVDRHGRLLAHLVRAEDGLWVQGALLADGLVRVYTFADVRALAADMYALEAAARQARRGLWAERRFAVLTPETVHDRLYGFRIVEGVVHEVAEVRRRVYLNFGADWRTDFTVSIAPGDRERFAEAGLDLTALQGRRVRVRGWVRSYNGPLIDADHPEQIEVLPP